MQSAIFKTLDLDDTKQIEEALESKYAARVSGPGQIRFTVFMFYLMAPVNENAKSFKFIDILLVYV